MKAKVNGIELFYETHGSGEPVFLVHRFPLNHTIWQPLLPFLPQTHQWILPDLRGFGTSSAPKAIYQMSELADDLFGLMKALGLSKITLLGHSMAGYACLAFAKKYPGSLRGLGLICTQAAGDNEDRRRGRYATAEQVEKSGVSSVAQGMAEKLTTRPELVPQLVKLINSTPTDGFCGAIRGMAEREDMLAFLKEIRVPTLVVGGGVDTLIPIERSREMAALLPFCKLVELPTACHMPMMELPKETAGVITDWLKANP